MTRSHSRRMTLLRERFFAEGQALAAAGQPEADCWLCRQTIDYAAAPNTTPDSHALDHYHPVADHPELQEDPTNFRHSHALCNTRRGKAAPSLGLGAVVPAWW